MGCIQENSTHQQKVLAPERVAITGQPGNRFVDEEGISGAKRAASKKRQPF
jgi:hypothetical protein